ncbi:MarR family winged helix-turn-helix transcriptional regulator [Kitasatospora sp. LaBMicrA B282]|uniref:MarR family winged helix-turn-helix transcriptional regulator n=1 Tax=Kitasatospora sp. LaBMicrA B282 TaxID=3420949 RepID=UPI003D0CF8B5
MTPRADLTMGPLSDEDHAFYGLVWAGTTLAAQVGRELVRAHDLPLSWFEVMLWLAGRQEPVGATELGAKTMLSRSQVSRVVDALEVRGLVVRTSSDTDARSVLIELTERGRAAFAEANETRRKVLAPVFTEVLDEAELAALVTVWRKLKAHRADGGHGPAEGGEVAE